MFARVAIVPTTCSIEDRATTNRAVSLIYSKHCVTTFRLTFCFKSHTCSGSGVSSRPVVPLVPFGLSSGVQVPIFDTCLPPALKRWLCWMMNDSTSTGRRAEFTSNRYICEVTLEISRWGMMKEPLIYIL